MKIFAGTTLAVCVVATSIACGSDTPISAVAPPRLPSPPAEFPDLTHPGTVYAEQGDLYAVFFANQGRMTSRYVIYDDGSFELQFVSTVRGFSSYAGTYTKSGVDLTLRFNDRDSVGAWSATGAVTGDEMTVTYNGFMTLADFVDGVYKKT